MRKNTSVITAALSIPSSAKSKQHNTTHYNTIHSYIHQKILYSFEDICPQLEAAFSFQLQNRSRLRLEATLSLVIETGAMSQSRIINCESFQDAGTITGKIPMNTLPLEIELHF